MLHARVEQGIHERQVILPFSLIFVHARQSSDLSEGIIGTMRDFGCVHHIRREGLLAQTVVIGTCARLRPNFDIGLLVYVSKQGVTMLHVGKQTEQVLKICYLFGC
jgi:hypothetical protein